MTEIADSSEVFASLSDEMQEAIADLGWREPMPVQAKVLPLMLEGGDLIVQAMTGSGKTGAFGIPIVEAVDASLPITQALILVPTRELANQVAGEIMHFSSRLGVRCLPVYGGVAYGPQLEALEEGAHIIVGTPGRILDHLGNGRMDLSKLRTLVFDEADEMLSLGFWPDMREIKTYLPKKVTTHLFSATIPEKVRSLSRYFLNDEQFISLSEDQMAPQEIEHFFYLVTAQQKEAMLARIIEFEDPESAIIFCNTKADVRYLTGYLQKRDFDCDQISGDLSQPAREAAIKRIKEGSLRFLIATDVAARGIDISDLSHVIAYATSDSPEVYVHRTGRTGRAGKSGVAISLVSGLDIGNFRHMQHVNKISVTERPIPTEKDILARIRDRLMVKVEQEMRATPKASVSMQVDRLAPVVQDLVTSPEGRRDLAAICAAYLRDHRPETTIPDGDAEPSAPAASREERPRRRRRTSGGGGGNRSGRNPRR